MPNPPVDEASQRSVAQDDIPLVDRRQDDSAEEERPAAIVGLFRPDVVMRERVRSIEQLGIKTTRPPNEPRGARCRSRNTRARPPRRSAGAAVRRIDAPGLRR